MRTLVLVIVGAAVVGCAGAAEKNTDSVSATAGRDAITPATPPVPGTFTKADFAKLRWLEGKWRGFMTNGETFYESYTWENDSTMVKLSFADTTFTNSSDRSTIALRGTTVSDESATARYVATRLDSIGVDFAPERGATNSFTFTRENATQWSATLRFTDAKGQPQTVIYALHRFGR